MQPGKRLVPGMGTSDYLFGKHADFLRLLRGL
jgi:hypothetical protein